MILKPSLVAVIKGSSIRWSRSTAASKSIKEYPELNLGNVPKDFKYRFNWNAPIISSPHDRSVIYHAGNVVFKTLDGGI